MNLEIQVLTSKPLMKRSEHQTSQLEDLTPSVVNVIGIDTLVRYVISYMVNYPRMLRQVISEFIYLKRK